MHAVHTEICARNQTLVRPWPEWPERFHRPCTAAQTPYPRGKMAASEAMAEIDTTAYRFPLLTHDTALSDTLHPTLL